MASMVQGHVNALHTTCLTTQRERKAVIVERVGGLLNINKVGERGKNASSGREGTTTGVRKTQPGNALDKINLSSQVRLSSLTTLQPIL